MSGLLNTNLNGGTSNLTDSTGRPFTTSFSNQSASVQNYHHSGLHNMHGNFNMQNMTGSLAPRNTAMSGIPSSGVQQPGANISASRFSTNNLPVAMSQIPHGHSGVTNRTQLNLPSNNQASGFSSSGLSSIGGAAILQTGVPSRSSNMTVNPVLGNLGPLRMGGNVGRTISSGGIGVSGIQSRMNVGAGGNVGLQGSSRIMGNMLAQGGPQMIGMLGNSYATSQNQQQGGGNNNNNALNAVGMLQQHELNSSDNTAPFDINDFPQLSGRPNSAGGPQGQFGNIRKQGVGVNTIVQQNQEFSIQNEDFPALPGYKGSTADYSMDLQHHKDQLHDNVSMMQAQHYPMGGRSSANFNMGSNYAPNRQQLQQSGNTVSNTGINFTSQNSQDLLHMHSSDLFSSHGAYHSQVQNTNPQNLSLRPLNNPNNTIGTYEQLIQQYQQPAQNTNQSSQFRLQQISSTNSSLNPFHKDQQQQQQQQQSTLKPGSSSLPSPSASDPYCLLGLLPLIRGNEPDLATLALGIDLTSLGLNLNSPENLYKTFGSPWSAEPAKGEPEFHIPTCYTTEQPPPLQTLHFGKFQSVTLFYIFYSMPKDEAQLYAASELYVRGWFYHRELRAWLTRVPNMEPMVKTQVYERGSYFCFDPSIWDTIRKDNFVLHYESIEKRPALPSATTLSDISSVSCRIFPSFFASFGI
ncbi:hypothetical protein LUZ60_011074 [Juncus effusus]|nr:hypothetical protein LUZ60_011074 [Juncus effusus]